MNSSYIVPVVYNEHLKLSKIMQIILLKAQVPIQLTAGSYINLSIECFGDVRTKTRYFKKII
jgi:hypothetical protein